MNNDFLEYYGEHSISPVRQDITDIALHYERRKKVYRQCGIPLLAFRNAELLEIGAGGGYNTLAFFHWNVKHVDIVEANPQGIADMQELFAKNNIVENQYTIYQDKIENYITNKKYDIVIAEGFLPYIYNQREVINKLQDLTASEAIVVITCSDDVCMFIESMKRLIGISLVSPIDNYSEKVDYLSELFEPQLKKLRGVSRSAKDWIQDQILNPAGVNGMELSLLQAIEYFEKEFDILGSSPHMFTDYSWYKDIWYDYKKEYKEQFRKKRLNLLQANAPERILPIEQSDRLAEHFVSIKNLAAKYEKTLEIDFINKIIEELRFVQKLSKQFLDDKFIIILQEIAQLLCCIQRNEKVAMENYPQFFCAFGRTQQYISFVKNKK